MDVNRKPQAVQHSIIDQLRKENEALRSQLEALRALSFEDALTGLKNRRYFDERLQAEIDRARRHRTHLSVVVIDIDHFKEVNDRLGHHAGDDLLKKVADLLRSVVREHDVVCRIGGDEFAIVLTGVDAAGGRCFLDRVRRRVSRQKVSLSLGLACWADHEDARAFVADADAAMYRDKVARKANRSLFAA